ncbi:MAG TPA: glycosyl transferase [Methylophilaceae bacterium]|nr:glycosyl transferase [Methylophilaceae bacterium]
MAFEIDHDWQGNLATPRARIGESAKNRLLIILCAVWICIGLLGHGPWKPTESPTISVVKTMLDGGSLLAPIPVSENVIQNPPLYYLSAAGLAKLLSPTLAVHDAARLASGFWMAITLLLVGMIGRELWGLGVGRQTTFIFMSSLGLIVTAHLLTPEVSALTGTTMGFYALALAKRRPFRASVLLGTGIGISFMSSGMASASILLITALLLPFLFAPWRTRSFAIVLGLSAVAASPWLVIWPALCWHYLPQAFYAWWDIESHSFNHLSHLYFLRTLAWFSWPALPIAGWGLWRYRAKLLFKPKFQLILTFFAVCLTIIGLGTTTNEIYALPLLLPLAALASGSVETLKRGAAGALNWFGLILFGLMGGLIWLGWIAFMSGWPAKLSERMHILSGLADANFNWLSFSAALLVSTIWLVTINAKRSNRAAVTEWAVGITMAWSLLMTLWLPMVDSAKSYEGVMTSLKNAVPRHHACINSRNLGNTQQDLLYYYTSLRTQPLEVGDRLDCDLYLIQDERGREKVEPGQDWKLVWHGKRPADRRESFRLYKHI